MKKLLILSLIFFSCELPPETERTAYYNTGLESITLDSCEYIKYTNTAGGITHKGNCKYCKQRSTK